ncbi:MAG TPA: hypothetical protein VGE07_06005 [Herpetosiphonaceae bacterium]
MRPPWAARRRLSHEPAPTSTHRRVRHGIRPATDITHDHPGGPAHTQSPTTGSPARANGADDADHASGVVGNPGVRQHRP